MTTARRRRARILAGLGILALLLAGGAVYAYFAPEASWLSWVLGLSAALLAVSTAVAVLAPRSTGAWSHARSIPDDDVPITEELRLTLECAHCHGTFDVADPGVRPLEHSCPHCGAQGILPEATPFDPITRVRLVEVACPRCGAHASVSDTGHRPLMNRCAMCGTLTAWDTPRAQRE